MHHSLVLQVERFGVLHCKDNLDTPFSCQSRINLRLFSAVKSKSIAAFG